jgi:hypothetical protein
VRLAIKGLAHERGDTRALTDDLDGFVVCECEAPALSSDTKWSKKNERGRVVSLERGLGLRVVPEPVDGASLNAWFLRLCRFAAARNQRPSPGAATLQ